MTTKIQAVQTNIIFQFVDAVNSKGQFDKGATESGIILQGTFDDSAKEPRWGRVIAVGANVENIQVGMDILIPALRWTAASKLDDEKFWMTSEKEVAAIRDPATNNFAALNDFVIFQKKKATAQQTSSLIVIENSGETPRGYVVAVGKKAEQELLKKTMFYSAEHMAEDFVHDGIKLALIKQDEVFMYTEEE